MNMNRELNRITSVYFRIREVYKNKILKYKYSSADLSFTPHRDYQ